MISSYETESGKIIKRKRERERNKERERERERERNETSAFIVVAFMLFFNWLR